MLLYCGFALTGIWVGSQEHAEDLYIHNSVDKQLISTTCLLVTLARRLGMTLGALLALLMLKSAIEMPAGTDIGNLAKAFSGLIILAVLAITMLLSLLFKEVSMHSRISHFTDGK
jgi:hypothetical protein